MSWWIKNVESFHKEPDATYTTKRANILCDTPEDLPQYNSQQLSETDPFILVYGSTAQVISTGRTYILNGSNQWIIQPQSGGGASSADQVSYDNTSSGMNATNVQDAIDETHSLDDMQDRALAELYAENTNQQLEINYAINTGSKNKLNNSATTITQSNATLTVNPDGTVSVTTNGATSANVSLKTIAASNNYAPNVYGGMIVSGVPSPDNGTALYVAYSNDGLSQAGSATVLRAGETAVINDSYPYIQVFVLVYRGSDIGSTPTVLKPMIRRAEISDDTFAPFARTNRELTVAETADRAALTAQVDGGSKNILIPILTEESTKEGITCTPNPDGTFTLNGTFPTTSSEKSVYFVVVNNAKLKELSDKYGAIDVICSGGSGIEPSQGRLRFYKIDTNADTYDSSATNKEISLTLSDNMSVSSANISIVVYRGQTLNNVVIKPMICTAADYAISTEYVPYAPTNRELYEDKATVDDIYGMGTAIPSNSDLNDYRTGGSYYAVNSSVANSISNIPIGGSGFRLIVRSMNTATYCRQEFYKVNQPEFMYIRTYNGTWSTWYKFTGEALQTASAQSVNSPMSLNLSRNDLNESLDSIQEEEEGEIE